MSADSGLERRVLETTNDARCLLEGLALELGSGARRGARDAAASERADRLARSVEGSRAAVYEVEEALKTDAGLVEAIERARRGIAEAKAALAEMGSQSAQRSGRALATLDRLFTSLSDEAIEREVRRDRSRARAGGVAPPPVVPPFRASLGTAERFRIQRPTVAVAAVARRADQELAEGVPPDQEDDDDEDDGEAAAPVADPSLEQLQLERLARYCLEEIAAMGALRRPTQRHAWSVAQQHEERLLQSLDALVALGARDGMVGLDVVGQAVRYESEQFAIDPGRAFARAFVLGCLDGNDAVDAAALPLFGSDPRALRGVCDGLSLASNPEIAAAVRGVLGRTGDAQCLAAALEIVRRRRGDVFGSVVPLSKHPDRRVRVEVARCLAAIPRQHAAAPVLEQMLEDEEDDEVESAVVEALAVQAPRVGSNAARELLGLSPQSRHAARLAHVLAVTGDAGDLPRIVDGANGSPFVLAALGWLGHPGAVGPLVAALDAAPGALGAGDGQRATLAEALERILGSGMRERLEGEDRLGDYDDAPVTAPHAWREFWASNEHRFDPATRYRFGEPYTLDATLRELEDPATLAHLRDAGALELAVAVGPGGILDVRDWHARQSLWLLSLRGRLGEFASAYPGRYPSQRPSIPG